MIFDTADYPGRREKKKNSSHWEMGSPSYCVIASRHLLSLLFEQMRCVRDRCACPHSSCDDRSFGKHCVICASLARCLYMQLNTVWALRRQRNSHRHQLLVQHIDGAVFERL